MNWKKTKDELPPEDTPVIWLYRTTKQKVGGCTVTERGKMLIGWRNHKNTIYPGGIGMGWFSHWMPLPYLPDDSSHSSDEMIPL